MLGLTVLGFDISWVWQAVEASLPTLIGWSGALGFLYWLTRNPNNKFGMYKGYVIQALKFVENEFENNPNPTVAKADLALEKFIEFFETNEGKTPSQDVQAWFNLVKEEVLMELDKIKAMQPVATVATPAPVAQKIPVPPKP